MNFLKKLIFKEEPTESDILNSGVLLAMKFGKDWLQPIQERLGRKYKFLSIAELDSYNAICKEVMDSSHRFVYDTLANCEKANTTITNKDLKESHRHYLSTKYSWLTKSSIKYLLNQGMYYARKDGYDQFVK